MGLRTSKLILVTTWISYHCESESIKFASHCRVFTWPLTSVTAAF